MIEMAPAFAPRHVANVKALVREGYFDGLAVMRVQDNYVAQWGDADAGDAAKQRPIRKAQRSLPAEFTVTVPPRPSLHPAPRRRRLRTRGAGSRAAFPPRATPRPASAWLAHCYAMVGAGRDNDADSGGGPELYAVIGHAPRHLDRNVTVFGRVVHGIERLSTLPRGTAPWASTRSRRSAHPSAG